MFLSTLYLKKKSSCQSETPSSNLFLPTGYPDWSNWMCDSDGGSINQVPHCRGQRSWTGCKSRLPTMNQHSIDLRDIKFTVSAYSFDLSNMEKKNPSK